ncbi:MAG: DNA cytosine methyltransferase [Cryophage ML09]|nr:MAG: DNA cytosine methyltransferase [Cryophage ML09]
MKHIDLFSGIGGFALAARWMGWETVQFCEKEPFAREVLNKNFPDVPISTDIFNLHLHECTERTILTGGFPCQPFSVAGERRGMEDARAIWPEMLRVIHEVRPNYVVAENVSGILTISDGLVFEGVCADLESEGYEVQPVIIPASGVGAYHQRARVWFVANANSNGRFWGRTDSDGENSYPSHRTGIQCETSRSGKLRLDSTDNANTTSIGRSRQGEFSEPFHTEKSTHGKAGESFNVCDWPTEPPVCGRADGLPSELVRNRAKQLKGYGNAIVPQVAYEIFKALTY